MKHDDPSPLSAKEEEAIIALIQHPTVTAASKATGISTTTLWRWLKKDEFKKHLRSAQRSVVNAAMAELHGATSEAVETLRRNLNCGQPFAENAAAQAILSHSLKAIEIGELTERVETMEDAVNELNKKSNKKG